MKTLQNDLTTPEQSKRLLELGVPKNSANHYYGKDGKLHYIDGTIPYSLLWETGCTPCWSVGRLMEILDICNVQSEVGDFWPTHKTNMKLHSLTQLEYLITWATNCKELLDFSKLEE